MGQTSEYLTINARVTFFYQKCFHKLQALSRKQTIDEPPSQDENTTTPPAANKVSYFKSL